MLNTIFESTTLVNLFCVIIPRIAPQFKQNTCAFLRGTCEKRRRVGQANGYLQRWLEK